MRAGQQQADHSDMPGESRTNQGRRGNRPAPESVAAVGGLVLLLVGVGLGLWADFRQAALERQLRCLDRFCAGIQTVLVRLESAGREWLRGEARPPLTEVTMKELGELADLCAAVRWQTLGADLTSPSGPAVLNLVREWKAAQERLRVTWESEGAAARTRYAEYHGSAVERWARDWPALETFWRVRQTEVERSMEHLRWMQGISLGLAVAGAAGLWWSGRQAQGRVGACLANWIDAVQRGRPGADGSLRSDGLWARLGERCHQAMGRVEETWQAFRGVTCRLSELLEQWRGWGRLTEWRLTEARAQQRELKMSYEALGAELNRWIESLQRLAGALEEQRRAGWPVPALETHPAHRVEIDGNTLRLWRERLRRLPCTWEAIQRAVISVVKAADQAQLLSINGAIEAEKAGEYGLGFAVVAGEIRRLADQTAVAAGEIEQALQGLREQVGPALAEIDSAVAAWESEPHETTFNASRDSGGAFEIRPAQELERRIQEATAMLTGLRELGAAMERWTTRIQDMEEGVREALRLAGRLEEVVNVLSVRLGCTAEGQQHRLAGGTGSGAESP
jgi:hypothetical protein